MSDRPEHPAQDQANQQPGGWHAPSSPLGWIEFTPTPTDDGNVWKVPAFPEELTEDPDETGGWHRPRPEDTTLRPEDEIEMTPQKVAQRQAALGPSPEDMIDQILGGGSRSTTRPEDTRFGTQPPPRAPADAAPRPEDFGGYPPSSPTSQVSAPPQEPTTPDIASPEDYLSRLPRQPREAEPATELDEEAVPEETDEALIPEDATTEAESVEEATAEAPSIDEEPAIDADEDDDEDDDESLSVTELMALKSLEEAMSTPGSARQLDESQLATLSPAERTALEAAARAPQQTTEALPTTDTQAEAYDPAEYARRQLAQFGQQESDATRQFPGDEQQQQQQQATGQLSPEEYARQQLSELGQAPAETGATPIPSGTQPYAPPQESELAQKFRQTRDAVANLRQQYNNGQLSRDELQIQLQQNMVLDDENVWWMMGIESDKWYRFDANSSQWQEAQPPVNLDQGGQAQAPASGGYDPNQFQSGSLPYLQDEGGQQPTEVSGQGDYGVAGPSQQQQQQYDPFAGVQFGGQTPQPAPQYDDQRTQVSGAAWQDQLPQTEPTMQSAASPGATMRSPSQAGDFGSLVERPQAQEQAADLQLEEQPAPEYEAQRQQQRAGAGRLLLVAVVVLLLFGVVVAAGTAGFVFITYNQTVEPYRAVIADLQNREIDFQTARILDAEGNLLAELNSGDGGARTPLDDLSAISPFFLHAIIAQEDERFYDNPGFDWIAVGRAFLDNLTAGEVVSGASTITQQVVRNFILEDSAQTPERKLTEALVAMELADTYSKNEILLLYLNNIFFANQSYGIEAAAQFYFDEPAADLNLAEAAFLAPIPNSPAANNPVINREQAIRNMRATIARQIEVGCLQFQHAPYTDEPFCVGEGVSVDFDGSPARLLTVNEDGTYGGVLSIWLAEVETRQYRPREADVQYPHFVNFIQAQIERDFGPDAMTERGFTVRTTLIPRIQDTAQQALENQVNALLERGVNTGAVMVTDPQTGAIRALVGSPDFNNEEIGGQVDNTRTWQQPGSAIKPVVYAAALEGGPRGYLTPISVLWDVPTTYSVGGQPYAPVNFDNRFHGPTPLRFSLQNSYNVAAVKAYEFVGNEKFLDVAQRLGLRFLPETTFGLPTALGANEVRLIDMMEAYGTFANDGRRAQLYAIESITETANGQDLDVPLPERTPAEQAITPQLAYLMQNILSDDQARSSQFGTNTALTLANAGLPARNLVGAKTGTTDGGRDLWTMGFTNNAVVGVWLGTFDDSQTVDLTGFTAAAPVWNQVMQAAIAARTPQEFENPGGVVAQDVCRATGTLDYSGCPARTRDINIQGQPPPPFENSFIQVIPIHTWTGWRANEWCQENVETQTFSNLNDPSALDWLNNTQPGQQYAQRVGLQLPLQQAPSEACQQGMTLPSVRLNNPTDGQTLTGMVTLTGQVTGPDFNRFQLEYAPVGSDQFTLIGNPVTQQFPDAGSQLLEWDTRTVPNGSYQLRLGAFANEGGSIFRTVQVNIQNTPPTPTPAPTATATLPPTIPSSPIPFDNLNPTPTATLDFSP